MGADFSSVRSAPSGEHICRYLFAGQLLRERKIKTVLDAACMNGYGSLILSAFAEKVIAVDMNKKSIEKALKEYSADNIEYHIADCTKLNFPSDFLDAAVCLEVIEHLGEHEQHEFLAAIKRVVKPSGLIIISTPDKFQGKPEIFRRKDHEKELTRDEFQQLLRHYFGEPKLYGQLIIAQGSLMSVFLKRLILGIAKRVFRSHIGKYLTLDKILNYQLAPLEEDQTAVSLTAICNNYK